MILDDFLVHGEISRQMVKTDWWEEEMIVSVCAIMAVNNSRH